MGSRCACDGCLRRHVSHALANGAATAMTVLLSVAAIVDGGDDIARRILGALDDVLEENDHA